MNPQFFHDYFLVFYWVKHYCTWDLSGHYMYKRAQIIFLLRSFRLKKQLYHSIHFSHQTNAGELGFIEKQIQRILARTVRFLVTWFSQHSCFNVQSFAIIGQLWHAIFSGWFMQLTWFIYQFVERNESILNHAHTWTHLLCYAHQSCKMLKFRYIFTQKKRS